MFVTAEIDREKAPQIDGFNIIIRVVYSEDQCDVLLAAALHNEPESEALYRVQRRGGRSEPRVALKGWIYCPAQRAGPITF